MQSTHRKRLEPMFHALSSTNRHRRIALGAIILGTVPLSVSAQIPEPIQRTAKVWGVGWGDGYHACTSSGCRLLADLPPRTFAASAALGNSFSGCASGQCAPDPSLVLSHGGGGTYYDQFDAQAHAFEMAQRAKMMMNHSRSIQPMIDPEAGMYPTTAWPNFRIPTVAPHPVVAPPIQPARIDANEKKQLNAPEMTPQELSDLREYQEHKRLKAKYDKYLIDPDEFNPSQQWGGPPAGSDERRKIDERRITEPGPSRPRLELEIDEEPKSPSDIGVPVERAIEDDELVPLDMTLPPFPTGLDEPLGPTSSTQPTESMTPTIEVNPWVPGSTKPLDAPEIETIPAGEPQLETRLPVRNRPVLGRRYIQQPLPKVAELPERRFVKQPERR